MLKSEAPSNKAYFIIDAVWNFVNFSLSPSFWDTDFNIFLKIKSPKKMLAKATTGTMAKNISFVSEVLSSGSSALK